MGGGVESRITQRAILGCNVMVGRVTEMEGKLCSGVFTDQRDKHTSNNWPPCTVNVYA